MDLQFGRYRISHAERLLLDSGEPVDLSARSFDILTTLLAKSDRVVDKAELFDAVWPGIVVGENTLHVHVSALRKALDPGMVMTVRGRGYKYAGPRPLAAGTEQAPDRSRRGDAAEPAAVSDYKPVIAVLPFTNMSSDPDQDYFSDGITEDIIVELSRYRPLNVVSRHSSSRFKGTAVDLEEAGRRLGARYLVEGSVRKLGDAVRVTAQLVDAATGSHVWAERYDRQLRDVFSMQDDLVRRIVSAIAGQVEKHTDSRARTKGTESLDAYDLWLRANHGSDLWTIDGNIACMTLLEEAIRKDPQFARAHASLAFCHIRAGQLMPGSPDIAMHEQAARRSAEHAVRLDPSEARAQNALGWSLLYLQQFERARARFQTSASLNPNDGSACLDRALALAFLGDQDAADEVAKIAAMLNPLGGDWVCTVLSIVHFMGRRYEAAEEFFAAGSTTLPDVLGWHAANLTRLGRHTEATTVMRQALEAFRLMWCGAVAMQPNDFVAWFRHVNMLRREADWEHVFEAFPKDVLASAGIKGRE